MQTLYEEDSMDEAGRISRRGFAGRVVTAMMWTALQTHATARPRTLDTHKNPGGDAMTTLTPYLLFDGNCKQAMEFYQSCLGGELTQKKVGDSPAKEFMPAYQHQKVVNARLRNALIDLSASDWLMPDRPRIPGNTVCLYLSAGSPEQLQLLFERLSAGADVTDPLREMFFGTYGALNDKFGVRWMFQCS
jgi:PhnB protein